MKLGRSLQHTLLSTLRAAARGPRTYSLVLILASAQLLACSASGTPTSSNGEETPRGGRPDSAASTRDVIDLAQPSTQTATAIERALQVTARAITDALDSDPVLLRSQLLLSLRDEATTKTQVDALIKRCSPLDDDAEVQAALISWWTARGEYKRAREAGWAAVTRFEERRAAFVKLWYASYSSDAYYMPPEVLELVEGETISALKLMVKTSSSLLYKVKKDDVTVAAFKPQQRLLLSNYRGEISAYRLCPLIRCGFSVPHNREARLSRATYESVREEDKKWLANRNRKGIKLVWFKDEAEEEWLYGTFKEWVPGFTLFPIEKLTLWDRMLVIEKTSIEKLETTPLADLLRRLEKRGFKKLHKEILERAEGVDSMEFARQLSNLHVFDVLTNNWDRYSNQPLLGLNCQWNHGQFVSLDNGATFPTRAQVDEKTSRHTTPQRHIQRRIQRFSRQTIDAIRWMDADAIYPILFPASPHHPDERERFELFWERRAWLLKHVDAMIKEHGEEEILAFP